MIPKKEVERIAKLARLNLTDKEVVKYQKELSLILDYIEKLKKQNLSSAEKRNYFLKIKNVFRQDNFSGKNRAEKQDLLNQFPKTENGYLKVKTIF